MCPFEYNEGMADTNMINEEENRGLSGCLGFLGSLFLFVLALIGMLYFVGFLASNS